MSRRLAALTLSSFDAGTLTNAYQPVIAGISNECTIIRIINNSDVSIMISYDGVNDHDVILKDNDIVYNYQFNNQLPDTVAKAQKGMRIFVKYILGAAKRGNIYLTGYNS